MTYVVINLWDLFNAKKDLVTEISNVNSDVVVLDVYGCTKQDLFTIVGLLEKKNKTLILVSNEPHEVDSQIRNRVFVLHPDSIQSKFDH